MTIGCIAMPTRGASRRNLIVGTALAGGVAGLDYLRRQGEPPPAEWVTKAPAGYRWWDASGVVVRETPTHALTKPGARVRRGRTRR